MKLQLMVAALLILSVVASAITIAESDSGTNPEYEVEGSVSVQEASEIGIAEADIVSIDSVDLMEIVGKNYRKVNFPYFKSFVGGLENSDSGYLASLGIMSVSIVKATEDNKTEIKVAAGRLRFGDTKYKLIASGSNVGTDKLTFYVLSKDSRLGNLEDIKSKSIGEFVLTKKKSFSNGYARWEAKLTVNGKSWEGTFYSTKEKRINPKSVKETREKDIEVEDGVSKIDRSDDVVGSVDSVDEDKAEEISKEQRKNWREFWREFFKKDRSGSNQGQN